MIYLDNAATTKPRKEAIDKMNKVLQKNYGNPSALYLTGREAHFELEKARSSIAKALGAKYPREIYFTSGGTESDNWAIRGAVYGKKGHIITSKIEHHAVLYTCENLEKEGYDVTYIEPDEFGTISPKKVEEAIREDTILISIMMANNEVGTINDVTEIGRIAHEHGIIFHTDAVQAVGHIPIDVQKQNIDLLSVSAHKFYAPKGVGLLYIKEGLNIGKLTFGGAQERNRRPGTENTASIASMATALELAVKEMNEESERLNRLSKLFKDELFKRLNNISLNGHPQKRLPGNVNILFKSTGSDAIILSLDMEGIAASSGSACSAGSAEASHVLMAMGLSIEDAKSSIRFTMGKYNTEEEILKAVEVIERTVKRIRSISPIYREKYKN